MNSGCVVSLNMPRMHELSNHRLSRVYKRGLLRHIGVRAPIVCHCPKPANSSFWLFPSHSFPMDKRNSGWLVAAFFIQHASAVILCLFAMLMSVCVCATGLVAIATT